MSRQFNEETERNEEDYVNAKADLRIAVEHTLLRFFNLQTTERKAEIYKHTPHLFKSWGAFFKAWKTTAPGLTALNLSKPSHAGGLRLEPAPERRPEDGEMLRFTTSMRTYYWVGEGDSHRQITTQFSIPALHVNLPPERRHLLPLSVQEQLAGLRDDEIKLDVHLLDSNVNRHLLAHDRTQFMLHAILFSQSVEIYRQKGDPTHYHDLSTNDVNPVRVGLFETHNMNEYHHDGIKFNELRQEDQIYHGKNFADGQYGEGIRSPANMQTQFSQRVKDKEEHVKFYFVGRWRDAINGKKALVSL